MRAEMPLLVTFASPVPAGLQPQSWNRINSWINDIIERGKWKREWKWVYKPVKWIKNIVCWLCVVVDVRRPHLNEARAFLLPVRCTNTEGWCHAYPKHCVFYWLPSVFQLHTTFLIPLASFSSNQCSRHPHRLSEEF